jgi:hypothetical protein
MFNLSDYPFMVLLLSLGAFWASALIGAWLHEKTRSPEEANRDDFKFVLGGTLTLLGLIIGFTFSMAVSRYEQRKNYEEEEANAIGTEYLRADFLSPVAAMKARSLLKSYLDLRILKYQSRDKKQLRQIDSETTRLQGEMWSSVATTASAQPSPVAALVVSGMNDVLNSQGYTQAAWWNRIPVGAWTLVISISIFCNVLVGYSAHGRGGLLLLILPLALSISLFLTADIDSPGAGVIRVRPQNLQGLAESLHLR